MSLKRLTVRGVEWEYATGGRGEQTILLFHGAVGGAETMQWLAENFADEYRTIAPTVADVSRLEEVCDAASAILDREHVGRAVVFGGSFGGLVAQAFLQRRRRQVEHLVLLSTGAPNRGVGARSEKLMKMFRWLPFPLLRALMKAELSRHLKTPVPPEHAARIADFRRRLDEYFDHRLTKATLVSRVALAADFNLRETYDAADYEDWPGRVLIIDANNDPMVSDEDRRRLHELFPRALTCTFEGAGHMIPLLHTEELIGLVKAFLKEDYKPPTLVEQCPAL
jgi:pimeloyl-ACP methyl ester carboxylesterase